MTVIPRLQFNCPGNRLRAGDGSHFRLGYGHCLFELCLANYKELCKRCRLAHSVG